MFVCYIVFETMSRSINFTLPSVALERRCTTFVRKFCCVQFTWAYRCYSHSDIVFFSTVLSLFCNCCCCFFSRAALRWIEIFTATQYYHGGFDSYAFEAASRMQTQRDSVDTYCTGNRTHALTPQKAAFFTCISASSALYFLYFTCIIICHSLSSLHASSPKGRCNRHDLAVTEPYWPLCWFNDVDGPRQMNTVIVTRHQQLTCSGSTTLVQHARRNIRKLPKPLRRGHRHTLLVCYLHVTPRHRNSQMDVRNTWQSSAEQMLTTNERANERNWLRADRTHTQHKTTYRPSP